MVILSGCTGGQEAPQGPYQVQVTEVKTLSDCIKSPYSSEVGLNDLCTHQEGMEFVLTENTQKIVGLCHPTINNADEPTLKVETLINGVRKEYEFDLTS